MSPAEILYERLYQGDFDSRYPFIKPLHYVVSGSRAYDLNLPQSDYDFIGIHIAPWRQCLIHPDFRPKNQVVKYSLQIGGNKGYIDNPNLQTGHSIDSFELWKFISLFLKGSIVAYELLNLPYLYSNEEIAPLLNLMREGLSSRFAKAARGIVMHKWSKDRTNIKKAIFAYYRLFQAIHYLETKDFESSANSLFNYKFTGAREVFQLYMSEDTRKEKLSEKLLEKVSSEIAELLDKLDRALVVTTLPDKVPRDILDRILGEDQKLRMNQIGDSNE